MSRLFLFITTLLVMTVTTLATSWMMISPWNDFIAPMLGAPQTKLGNLFVALMFVWFLKILVGKSSDIAVDFNDWNDMWKHVGELLNSSTAIVFSALAIKCVMLLGFLDT